MKIIERGWLSYKANVISKKAGKIQIEEIRQAFYSGASILFSVLTGPEFLENVYGEIEPTQDDLSKMDDVQKEIDTFGAELNLKILGSRRH